MGTESREGRRKRMELEAARKAGVAQPAVDEDGNQINPHIPLYISSVPFYLNPHQTTPSLKHQRKRKPHPNRTTTITNSSGAKIHQAHKFRPGACHNCGASTHDTKACTERPRKLGAKWTGKNIAPDEKIEAFDLDYEGKHDRWHRFDFTKSYPCKYHEEEEEEEDGLRVDEGKQQELAKLKNLRIREDKAKYLHNLDLDSAYYDPKSRSMREDPLPHVDLNDKFYSGDNRNRMSGQALEFRQLNLHALKASRNCDDNCLHVQAAPSQAEFLYRDNLVDKEKLISRNKESVLKKYGNTNKERT